MQEAGNPAFGVYRDEPILIGPAQKEFFTPPRYPAMRKLAKSGGSFHKSEAQIFYEQGKFMEDFEDDFDYHGDFMQYFPTYQSMNNAQLRGYFSWRTKVRRGVIERTPLSFVFVYIYELLNRIGVRTPDEGFHALKNFRAAYSRFAPKIDRYVNLWLKDYVVYYNLDKSLLEGLEDIGSAHRAALTLFDHQARGEEEVFSALNSLSSYDLEGSRFFKKYPEDVRKVVCGVFTALSEHCKKLLGEMYTGTCIMFRSAVFYDRIRRKNFVYTVSDLCRYTCKGGNWSCERFFCYRSKNRLIGELLKTIDFVMRRKYKFKSVLKAGEISEEVLGVIEMAADNYLERKREAARPKIEIDVSKLHNIREAALETQEKLLVEDAEEIAEPDEAAAEFLSREEPAPENHIGLSGAEYMFLKCLLYGQDYDGPIKQTGLPVSVVADSVNETLFDLFGDAVIIDADGRPELAEDYIEELKGIISA